MQDLLKESLLKDVRDIGIDIDFNLEIKLYSKSYLGAYRPKFNKVTLYLYENAAKTKMYPYRNLLFTLIHELCHCIQWHSDDFVRVKGVMHDPEFYTLYNKYTSRANVLLLFKEVSKNENKRISLQ